MFRIVYINDEHFPYGYYKLCSRHGNLEAAKAARRMSGDVVVDDEGQIVTDRGWLWDWEKEPTEGRSSRMGIGNKHGPHKEDVGRVSYALRCIQKQETRPLPYLRHMRQLA